MLVQRISKEDYVELTAPVIKDIRDEDGGFILCRFEPLPFFETNFRDDDEYLLGETSFTKVSSNEVIFYCNDGGVEYIYLIKEGKK